MLEPSVNGHVTHIFYMCLRSLRSLSFCLIDLLRIIRQGCIEVFLRQSSSHCFNRGCIVWVGNHAIKI